MRVHPAAVLPEDRLRHERREQSELRRDVLHDEAERRDVVGRLERVGIAEVDLVLAVRHFVMRRLDLEPHALERVDHRAARVFAEVRGREIEVAADVVRVRRSLAPCTSGLKRKNSASIPAFITKPIDFAFASTVFSVPRGSPAKGLAVRRVDVADQPADAIVLIAPRIHEERVEIGRRAACPTPRCARTPRSTTRRT